MILVIAERKPDLAALHGGVIDLSTLATPENGWTLQAAIEDYGWELKKDEKGAELPRIWKKFVEDRGAGSQCIILLYQLKAPWTPDAFEKVLTWLKDFTSAQDGGYDGAYLAGHSQSGVSTCNRYYPNIIAAPFPHVMNDELRRYIQQWMQAGAAQFPHHVLGAMQAIHTNYKAAGAVHDGQPE